MSDPQTQSVNGRVVRDGAGKLWLDVPRRSACQSCGKSSGCGMSVLGSLGGDKALRLSVEGLDVKNGDMVALSCPSASLLKAAFLAYGLPALGLVVGAVVPALAGLGDGAQALGAVAGLGLGFGLTRWAVARGHMPALTFNEE